MNYGPLLSVDGNAKRASDDALVKVYKELHPKKVWVFLADGTELFLVHFPGISENDGAHVIGFALSEDAHQGLNASVVPLKVLINCSYCDGYGYVYDERALFKQACFYCDGKGEVLLSKPNAEALQRNISRFGENARIYSWIDFGDHYEDCEIPFFW